MGDNMENDNMEDEDLFANEELLEVIDLDENNIEDDGGVEEDEDAMDEREDVPDDADLVFDKHTGSVLCCDIDPKSCSLVASGGQDDRAFVWDSRTGEVVFECTGHTDSVSCTSFSGDGTYLATGDMSGNVKVWKVDTKSLVWSYETDDLNCLTWHPVAHVLLGSTESGEIYMWKIPSGECKVLAGHGSGCEAVRVMPDGRRGVSTYQDGTIKIFDLKEMAVIHRIDPNPQTHSDVITSLDCHLDNKLIATGSADGSVIVTNSETGKYFSCVRELLAMQKSDSKEVSVEAVRFCPDQSLSLLCIATLQGDVNFWDYSKQTCRRSYKQEEGISRLVWDLSSPVVYASGLDGTLRVYDARSESTAQFTGHTDGILDLCLARDGSLLVTASDDNTCRIFNLSKAER